MRLERQASRRDGSAAGSGSAHATNGAAAPWVLERCARISLKDNPLDVDTLTTILPAMCDLDALDLVASDRA